MSSTSVIFRRSLNIASRLWKRECHQPRLLATRACISLISVSFVLGSYGQRRRTSPRLRRTLRLLLKNSQNGNRTFEAVLSSSELGNTSVRWLARRTRSMRRTCFVTKHIPVRTMSSSLRRRPQVLKDLSASQQLQALHHVPLRSLQRCHGVWRRDLA